MAILLTAFIFHLLIFLFVRRRWQPQLSVRMPRRVFKVPVPGPYPGDFRSNCCVWALLCVPSERPRDYGSCC